MSIPQHVSGEIDNAMARIESWFAQRGRQPFEFQRVAVPHAWWCSATSGMRAVGAAQPPRWRCRPGVNNIGNLTFCWFAAIMTGGPAIRLLSWRCAVSMGRILWNPLCCATNRQNSAMCGRSPASGSVAARAGPPAPGTGLLLVCRPDRGAAGLRQFHRHCPQCCGCRQPGLRAGR